jgi:hypothetical protein
LSGTRIGAPHGDPRAHKAQLLAKRDALLAAGMAA